MKPLRKIGAFVLSGEIEIDVNGKYVQSKFHWFAFESDVQRNSTFENVTSQILQNLNQGNEVTKIHRLLY